MAQPPRDTVLLRVGGQDIRMVSSTEELPLLEKAARRVDEQVSALADRIEGTCSPAKVATMVALQMAFDLTVSEQLLENADRLREELTRQKEAVARLESLLGKMEDALTT